MMASTPGQQAWRKLRSNVPAMGGLLVIVLGIVLAIFGYLIVPDGTTHANDQSVALKLMPPGSKARVLLVRLNRPVEEKSFLQRLWSGQAIAYQKIPVLNYHLEGPYLYFERYTGDPDKGVRQRKHIADIVFAQQSFREQSDTIITTMVNGDVKRESIADLQAIAENQIQSETYWLGTDALGRDYLSRLLLGARVSLSVGLMAVMLSLLIGLVLGSLAGYFRGWVDRIIVYVINVFWSIPTLLLALSLSLVFSKGFLQVFMAIGLTMWIELARIVRGQVLGLREQEYIKAAQTMAFSHARIVFRHIWPNLLGPVIVIVASNFAAAILLEAGLSFLGLGVERPAPSWGMMLSDNRTYLIADRIHLAIWPGVAISVFVLSFFLLGNGLRDAFDVRKRTD